MGQKLGQHFLVNKNKIQKIVEALELKNNDVVVEIGPGHGELTGELANWLIGKKLKTKIIAIEKDKILAKDLKEKFKDNKNIEISEGDALKIIPELSYKLQVTSYKLTGNIPYYITGKLLRILSESGNKPSIIVLTIQKEVAERICGIKAGSLNSHGRVRIAEGRRPKARYSHAMNLLAAIVQFWAEPKIVGYISRHDFKPAPKVDSAIIRLTTYGQQLTTEETEKYYKFVRALFKQPRKTIINNLRPATNNSQLLTKKIQLTSVNPNDRPQNLSLAQIKDLSTLF